MSALTSTHTPFDQLLYDLFTTALEGGIGYWSAAQSYHRLDSHEEEDLRGFYSDCLDRIEEEESDTPVTVQFRIDRALMLRGYRLACGEWRSKITWSTAKPPLPHDAAGIEDWDYDAGDADCIVQLGLFGEVRYG